MRLLERPAPTCHSDIPSDGDRNCGSSCRHSRVLDQEDYRVSPTVASRLTGPMNVEYS